MKSILVIRPIKLLFFLTIILEFSKELCKLLISELTSMVLNFLFIISETIMEKLNSLRCEFFKIHVSSTTPITSPLSITVID